MRNIPRERPVLVLFVGFLAKKPTKGPRRELMAEHDRGSDSERKKREKIRTERQRSARLG